MAKVTVDFNVPDNKAQLFLDAFCSERDYNPTTHGTQIQFFRAEVREFVELTIRGYFIKVRNTEAQIALKSDLSSIPITTN